MTTMVEIDIEDIFAGTMSFEGPVLRGPCTAGNLGTPINIETDIDFGVFTSGGQTERLVYNLGNFVEISLDDIFISGMGGNVPIVRDPYVAGLMNQIPIGGQNPLPGDTMYLIDFTENARLHIVNIVKGLIKSWTVNEGATKPLVPNTHTISMTKGLIQSWTIVSGGIRQEFTNNVNILKGLIQGWSKN